ncbi:ATP-binding protein [Melioribacteraceae bacterium 4301-Me]|uniref:sensor histidine kinase n=1 Tax=Pyranulibacter aquaticus TaxID=3163344 RepID=UPI00359BAE53
MELLLGVIIYIYLFTKSLDKLDSALAAQANAIIKIVKEKHVDLDTFTPDENYQNEEDLVWDLIYDIVVFNKRNTYIEISSGNKIIFKTDNLSGNDFLLPNIALNKKGAFDFVGDSLSQQTIRGYLLKSGNYAVLVAYPKDQISQTLNSLTDLYILLAPLFLIISFLGGAIISSKSLSRIDAIVKKTEEITAQNMSEKIPGEEFTDEYGRLVRKMNEMIDRIKTSVDYMNQFTIFAAHELKTPLTILRGEIEIALKSPKTVDEYIEVLKSNHEETIRLIKIIDNLFFISKSDHSLINVQKVNVNLEEFLNAILNNFIYLANEKQIKIVSNIPKNINVKLDTGLMKQAITNLLDNAIKYGNENSELLVSAENNSENKLKIDIANTGDEIPPEALNKIFERFYRVENPKSQKKGGVGLGLSVVKSIINLHNGDIMVDSKFGRTKVSILMPLS